MWSTNGWAQRFGLALDVADTGYGHSSEQVAAVDVQDGALLVGYMAETVSRSTALLREVSESDLDRVVDERWDPPVTLGVRLVSVVDDDVQHLGQAAFARGIIEGR